MNKKINNIIDNIPFIIEYKDSLSDTNFIYNSNNNVNIPALCDLIDLVESYAKESEELVNNKIVKYIINNEDKRDQHYHDFNIKNAINFIEQRYNSEKNGIYITYFLADTRVIKEKEKVTSANLYVIENLKEIDESNSLLLQKGTIASLNIDNKYEATTKVEGNNIIEYKGNRYENVENYPDDLYNIIKETDITELHKKGVNIIDRVYLVSSIITYNDQNKCIEPVYVPSEEYEIAFSSTDNFKEFLIDIIAKNTCFTKGDIEEKCNQEEEEETI